MKKILAGIVALACSGMIAAAVTGKAPPNNGGFRLMDSNYVLGIVAGVNSTFTSGLTAAGTTQATATALPSNTELVQVDTTAASTGVNLPFCLAGTKVALYNNGANTLTVYPSVLNNPVTAAQDTINNGTSVTVATHVAEIFFCAKNAVWAAK